ncbi:hypothetical protein Glove_59g50 [Diversispora epigaea]|uniref:Uncharacterized protein n=1 Tax=Diversispora epigaea TaxID=1348612 RepID=A0A397JKZ5_9GLOM|nr:hypothetical protein Glove_59g50 [Diversispora epigaea]
MPHSLYKRKFLSVLKEGCGTIGSYGAVIDKYFVTGITLTFQQEISPLQETNIILDCFEMYRICSFTEFEIKTILLQYLNTKNNQDSEYEDEDEKNEIDTGSTRKRKRKLARAIQQELPYLYPILNCSFIHNNLIGHSFGCQHILTLGAGATGRRWLDFTQKELLIWIALVIYQELFKLPFLTNIGMRLASSLFTLFQDKCL